MRIHQIQISQHEFHHIENFTMTRCFDYSCILICGIFKLDRGDKMHHSKTYDYYVNQHSCFLLQYHLVLVTRYRKPVITGELEDALRSYTQQYFKKQGLVILELNAMPDHIHILFEAPPQLTLAGFVNAFKSASSRCMRSVFSEQLKTYYWKPYFWSMSYFIATVSERSTAAVKEYIKHQKD